MSTAGLMTLDQLLAIGLDMEEFLPEILCRLTTAAFLSENGALSQDVDTTAQYVYAGSMYRVIRL